jgi:hypothetical protein
MTSKRQRDNPWSRLIGGLMILIVGVIFWLDHLGRIDASDYYRWWPLFFVAFGVAHLPQRRWIAATVYIVIGVALLPPLPFLPNLRLGELIGLWPLLISAGGVTLLMQALRPAAKDAKGSGAFRLVAWMGGSGRTIAADNFVGGDAVAVMGGCEIDLTNAKLDGEAVIDVLAFWGGIEIIVPRTWRTEAQVTALLGGMTDRTDPVADGPRLIVRGSAIMGGIEVRNPKEVTR